MNREQMIAWLTLEGWQLYRSGSLFIADNTSKRYCRHAHDEYAKWQRAIVSGGKLTSLDCLHTYKLRELLEKIQGERS